MRGPKQLLLTLAAALLLSGCMRTPGMPDAPESTPEPEPTAPIVSETPTPTPEPPPEPTPEPQPQRSSWTLSFAGDCTIGTLHEWQGAAGRHNMLSVMDGDWSYPFSGVSEVFSADDFTMVNLEGTFTEQTDPVAKSYRFRAPPEAAQTLPLGGIEAVTLANNHSGDYRQDGLQDTRDTLDALGVLWADAAHIFTFQLPDDGPLLGAIAFNCVEIDLRAGDVEGYMRRCTPLYDACREAGCDLVIAYLHWGWEYRSAPEGWMVDFAHRLAELGCDMVVGSHPHILQGTENCEGVPICYSLGNFCFGGHSGPEDMDSVIVQQSVLRTAEGFSLGETRFLPCSISSSSDRNDFRPTLFAPEDPGYARVLKKLGVS